MRPRFATASVSIVRWTRSSTPPTTRFAVQMPVVKVVTWRKFATAPAPCPVDGFAAECSCAGRPGLRVFSAEHLRWHVNNCVLPSDQLAACGVIGGRRCELNICDQVARATSSCCSLPTCRTGWRTS
jgi:hypothetical protein